MAKDDATVAVVENNGLFIQSLKRNIKDIKDARATAISDDAEMSYRRMVEDLIQKRKRLLMERAEMLDMSPETAHSLVLAKNFDGRQFSTQDLDLGVNIRTLDIQIDIGKTRYTELFGKEI